MSSSRITSLTWTLKEGVVEEPISTSEIRVYGLSTRLVLRTEQDSRPEYNSREDFTFLGRGGRDTHYGYLYQVNFSRMYPSGPRTKAYVDAGIAGIARYDGNFNFRVYPSLSYVELPPSSYMVDPQEEIRIRGFKATGLVKKTISNLNSTPTENYLNEGTPTYKYYVRLLLSQINPPPAEFEVPKKIYIVYGKRREIIKTIQSTSSSYSNNQP